MASIVVYDGVILYGRYISAENGTIQNNTYTTINGKKSFERDYTYSYENGQIKCWISDLREERFIECTKETYDRILRIIKYILFIRQYVIDKQIYEYLVTSIDISQTLYMDWDLLVNDNDNGLVNDFEYYVDMEYEEYNRLIFTPKKYNTVKSVN